MTTAKIIIFLYQYDDDDYYYDYYGLIICGILISDDDIAAFFFCMYAGWWMRPNIYLVINNNNNIFFSGSVFAIEHLAVAAPAKYSLACGPHQVRHGCFSLFLSLVVALPWQPPEIHLSTFKCPALRPISLSLSSSLLHFLYTFIYLMIMCCF